MSSDSFSGVMTGLRAGDSAAAAAVFQRFSRRLVSLACRQFETWISPKADPEDVVQSVFKSFFIRYATGHFDVDGWDQLWSLLTVITVRKCGERRDFLRAGRRDAGREVALEGGVVGWMAVDREPTPDEAAVLADLVNQLLHGLEPKARQAAELSLQGYTAEEIAARLECSERTVFRVRDRLKARLRQLLREAGYAE